MSDRGFTIQDLCREKGIYLNSPKEKDQDQFSEKDIQKNFNIASTRIHGKRFTWRVHNFTFLKIRLLKIFNNTCSMNRMNLLGSTWQMLCHIVNITLPPIILF